MRSILVFDQMNGLTFHKCDSAFIIHILKLGKEQGLYHNSQGELEKIVEKEKKLTTAEIDEIVNTPWCTNLIIQLFSPILTSYKVLNSQFANSYSSLQCENNVNFIFEQFMDHIFTFIGDHDVSYMKKILNFLVSAVKYFCGPDVALLAKYKQFVSLMMDTWDQLVNKDQAFLLEAVEQLSINGQIAATTISVLENAAEKFEALISYPKIHTLIFVENKLLSLYSSRKAKELTPADILFLTVVADTIRYQTPHNPIFKTAEKKATSLEEVPETNTLKNFLPKIFGRSNKVSYLGKVYYFLMMMGPQSCPSYVYITYLADGIPLFFICEVWNELFSQNLQECLKHVMKLHDIQNQPNPSSHAEEIKSISCLIDVCLSKMLSNCKKKPAQSFVEESIKQLYVRWEQTQNKFKEYLKNQDAECLTRLETCTSNLVHNFKDLIRRTLLDTSRVNMFCDSAKIVTQFVDNQLKDFIEFLRAKALKNFTLESRSSLNINRYLEEFPGLVHFIYIDRSNHRIIAPSLNFSDEDTIEFIKKKIWSSVKFCQKHLQNGHMSVIWRDATFNYAYFLWFEDSSGIAMKPNVFPSGSLKPLPMPGMLTSSFYPNLINVCFPNSNKTINCYELYCVHLGIASSSCVLEHTRRIHATIWEVTGFHNNSIDLL
ncbi:unnamed protein product [Bemisia tabaci]|uniref:Hermansky-Pudlak syndrome 1 n=1 Tax=Bemisia tabaci TaxID=7038 RepID=A0A9P0A6R9_BEMTA|nr:unnamed protein product [Bemisia tabaci]